MRERRHEDVPEPRQDGGSWLDRHRLGRRADGRAARALMDSHDPLLKDPGLTGTGPHSPLVSGTALGSARKRCLSAHAPRAPHRAAWLRPRMEDDPQPCAMNPGRGPAMAAFDRAGVPPPVGRHAVAMDEKAQPSTSPALLDAPRHPRLGGRRHPAVRAGPGAGPWPQRQWQAVRSGAGLSAGTGTGTGRMMRGSPPVRRSQ